MKRPDPFSHVLAAYAMGALLILGEPPRETLPEVEIAAILVEREDPFPCLSDPLIREACDRQRCVNRCEEE